MGVLDLARRLDALSRWDSPKSVPVGQGRSGALGGTVGTRGTAGASGTVGTRERSDDDVEERAGMAADRVPAVYLETWPRITHRKLLRVSEADWRRALNDGGLFLDAWGEEAAALRWPAVRIFDVPAGFVWRLRGERVETLGADHARLADGRAMMRNEERQ